MQKKIMAVIISAVVLVLSGCASDSASKAQFGDAVRHMTEKQIHNLDAAYNPDPAAVTGGDPDSLNDVLDRHRANATELTEDRGTLRMSSSQ